MRSVVVRQRRMSARGESVRLVARGRCVGCNRRTHHEVLYAPEGRLIRLKAWSCSRCYDRGAYDDWLAGRLANLHGRKNVRRPRAIRPRRRR